MGVGFKEANESRYLKCGLEIKVCWLVRDGVGDGSLEDSCRRGGE